MASSGSGDFNLTRNEIIERALRIIGKLEQGLSPSAEQVDEAVIALNTLVKDIQNKGVYLWTLLREQKVFTSPPAEVIGTDGVNYTCILTHKSSTNDEPVTGQNFSTFWIARGTSGVAWADAIAFGSVGDFLLPVDTLGIQKIWIRQNNTDLPMTLISRDQYYDLARKDTEGIPELAFIDMLLPQPTVFIYPQHNQVSRLNNPVHFLRERMLFDFDATTDTPDFRSRWLRALSYGLADDLADEYQVPLAERQIISAKAERFIFQAIKSDNREFTDEEFIQPAYPTIVDVRFSGPQL